jgi:nitrogen fixation protein FixH
MSVRHPFNVGWFALPRDGGDGTERRWTGRTILLTLLGFFGVVFAVNGVMIYEALSTLSGVDTDSAYQAGLQFEQEVATVKAQDSRQWRVDAKLTPMAGGERLDVSARDAAGQPLGGMQASAIFERPTDRRLDRSVVLVADAAGRFHGSAEVAIGQWDIVIVLSRQGEQMFRSKNRVILK